MTEYLTSWHDPEAITRLTTLVSAASENAARGLSGMVGRSITTSAPRSRVVRFDDISTYIGSPESEMVGIYLLMEGNLSGQAIMILSLVSALNLADWLMDEPSGTSSILGSLERSALAEVGNLTVSYFLNAMAALTGKYLRPSPPAVMVEMLGAIINVVVTPMAMMSDDMLIIETILQDPEEEVQAYLWVLPDLKTQIANP
jgi:chemotaxis protein CheC